MKTTRKRGTKMPVSTPIRLPEALRRRLDAYAGRLRREQPGITITRSDVMRLLLERGLDALEGKGGSSHGPA